MLKKFKIKKLSACVISIALLVSQMVFAPAVSAASTTYEAENAALAGGAVVGTDHTGYTGTGFVEGYTDSNKGNANTTFTVSASSAGSFTTTLRYSNGSGSTQTLSLYVNGTKIKQISLGTSSDWNTWTTEQESVSLNSGSNTISYKFDSTDSGNVNLDNITLAASLGTNLAAGKTITANNTTSGYPATNANDSNTSTYWEGAANTYPNTLTVDLGTTYTVGTVVVQLPSGWGSRTQTLSVLGSTDNSTYNTIVSSNTYTFDPSFNTNTVTITFTGTTARYVELSFTANSGATAGQVAEFQVYGTSISQVATPTFSPAGGSYQAAQSVTISDGTSGATIHYTTDGSTPTSASPTYSSAINVSSTETIKAIAQKSGMADSSVASATYTICPATPTFSPAGGTYSSAQSVTLSDGTTGAVIHYTTDGSTPTDSSATYSSPINVPSTETIKCLAAKSGMSDSPVASATYTISLGTNVAAGKTITANNTYSGFPATNANDSNTSTYWEGAANSYPNTLTVDLGSTYTCTAVSVLLPVSGWGTRTQTFSVLGSTDGTTYNTIVSSNTYTFNPTSNNTVNITFTGTVERYLELSFTANSGSTAGQVGEFQVYGTSISQAATPTFSPAGGSYQTTQSVTLSDTTTGAVIHYTTDGSTPTASSATYSSAIQVSSSETINAIAIASGYANSNVGSATYTICPATPTFSPGSGTYSSAQTVTISDATTGTTIHYTTDGSTPTASSATYTAPITVSTTETVNAIAVKSGMSNSAVGTATYTINVAGTVTYEAENAFYYGGVAVSTSYSGYQGTGYLNNWTAVGDKVIFSANAPSAGNYSVTLRYSNGNSSAKTLSVYANGTFVVQTSLSSTSNWTTWAVKTETIPLRAGMNTITYQYTSSDSGNVDVDNMAIANTTANATRGATLPYQEYEAESGTTNATITADDRALYDVPSEASGRKAVELTSTGNYVTVTLTAPANALVIRYCIPDATSGGGITAPLSLYINGTKNQDLSLSSYHSWSYNLYPNYSDTPGNGSGHHFFDDVQIMLGSTYAVGTTITLQKDNNDTAAYYYIDLVDAENVAPALTMPSSGFLSITSYGATANDGTDDTTAINNCISAAQSAGKGVWIPTGTFNCNTAKINVPSGMVIRGAGMWYSILSGKYAGLLVNGNFQLYDFSLYGNEYIRDDGNGTAGIEGNGTNSVVQNIWFEHLKVGMWINNGTNGFYAEGDRIRDTYADGVNLNGYNGSSAVSNSMLENCEVRYTGDDGLAMWSSGGYDTNDTYRFNTIQLPWLANCIAIYGGQNNTVSDNMCYDTTAFGGGIEISTDMQPVGFTGTLLVTRNTLTRCSGYEYNLSYPRGAVWVHCVTALSATITVSYMEIDDSTYQGISLEGSGALTNITFSHDNINKCGTYGIDVRSNESGSGEFDNVTVSNCTSGGLINSAGSNFTINRGSGNSGW